MQFPSKVAIASDHAGYDLKEVLISFLEEHGVEVKDFGTNSHVSCDYPDYVHPLCDFIEEGGCEFGILICGSANGVAITANKHQNIRAAICWREDITALARQHNDANICCIPARFVEVSEAYQITEIFLTTDFEGGRHQNRVNKIAISK
jgi:ribose 5-phosphate isomerase B